MKEKPKKKQETRWVWSDDHVASLLNVLKEYKTLCDFENIDFEADSVKLTENARSALASLYPIDDFGPENIVEEKSRPLATRGRKRVRDKITKLRKLYRESVKENRRSGGGKVTTENWDVLVFLWEGCPSVTSLPFAQCSSREVTEENLHEKDESDEEDVNDVEVTDLPSQKIVKTFVDDKRRNLQKNLSAGQRDQIYLKLAREDIAAKQDMVLKATENSTRIANSIQAMADGMSEIASGLKDGMCAIANAISGLNNRSQWHQQYYHGNNESFIGMGQTGFSGFQPYNNTNTSSPIRPQMNKMNFSQNPGQN